MTKVTITQAAKMARISRSTMYNKYINIGIISVEAVDGKKLIDMSELIRVFGNVQLGNNNVQPYTPENIPYTNEKDKIIELLQQQLNESKSREQEAKEREEWLKLQLEKTTHLLEDKTKSRKKFLGIF